MKIAYLTAGTGNFYCGTCLRDHSLALGLRAMGHDVVIMPLYLPLVTEDKDQGDTPIFMGGINTYLQQKFKLFRKTPRWLDKIFDSLPMLNMAARFTGMTKPMDLGQITLATLKGVHGPQIKEFNRVLAWLKEHGKPDVICLSNALLTGFAEPIASELEVPLVCSLQGEDTFIDKLPKPYDEETWQQLSHNVRFVDAYVAVSQYHGDLMANRMRIPPEKIHVVPNGIDLDGYADLEPKTGGPPTIGFLAALIPAKGLETIIDAFILLRQRGDHPEVRLKIAGSSVPGNEGFVRKMESKLKAAGCEEAYDLATNISREEKLNFFTELDVFSVPATYGESFGLYVIESMAAGVPVVQPNHAAFPEILGNTGGGLLCQPDDVTDLADSLSQLLSDQEGARFMGQQGRKAVFDHYSSRRMAESFEETLLRVTGKESQTPLSDAV